MLNCAFTHLSHLKKALKKLLKLSLIRDFKTWGQSSQAFYVKRFPQRGVARIANEHIALVYMLKLSGGGYIVLRLGGGCDRNLSHPVVPSFTYIELRDQSRTYLILLESIF